MRPSATLPIRLISSCLGTLALAGCLTSALWNWTDPDRVPELATSVTRCEVEGVLARTDADVVAPGTYAIAFRPLPGAAAPLHLIEQARAGAAWLLVEPLAEFPATRAMDSFVPRGYHLAVFDGTFLRRRTNNVRMTLLGTVARSAIASEVDPSAVPADLRDTSIPSHQMFPWGPLHRALEGLGAQDWLRLAIDSATITPEGDPEPIAFLDPDGAPMSLDAIGSALLAPAADPRAALAAHATLLARVRDQATDTITYFEVPVPVLLNASDLTLVPNGDTIAFAWARRGQGRFLPERAVPDGLVRFGLPLARNDLDYEWSTELPNAEPFAYSVQILLSPFAAIIDWVIESNASLRALRDMLFPPPPPPPVRPRRGN